MSSGEGYWYDNMVELMDFGRPTEVVLRDLEKLKMRGGYFKRDFVRVEEEASDPAPKDVKPVDPPIIDIDPNDVDPSDPLAKIMAFAKQSQNMTPSRTSVRPAVSMSSEIVDPTTLAAECDFNSGLILAGDVLHRYTAKKRYNRKIYLITDGEVR